MTKEQAYQHAVTLRHEGLTYSQIAKRLGQMGYVSEKFGKPISMGGAHDLLHRFNPTKGKVKRKGKKHRRRFLTGNRQKTDPKMQAIGGVLRLDNVDDSTKLSLAQLILES